MSSEKPKSEADERLSQLLRLKRQERPDAAFWDKFDEELRSKQLGALVRTQSWYERLGKLSLLVARKSAAATAAVSIFALGIFGISRSEFFAGQESIPEQPAIAASQAFQSPELADEAPLFVVEERVQSPQRDALDATIVEAFNAPRSYEIHTLHPQATPKSYQVIAAPKQFTAGEASGSASLGAKVIRTGNQY